MARPPFYERLFRALLRLFPSEFRGDFGEDMTADFRDQRLEIDGKPREVRRLWIRTAMDLLRRAPREHLDVVWRDVVYALRVLRRHPAATATAVLSLAIGIGLNSAIYSVVGGVLWRSLPFTESDRLVIVGGVGASNRQPDLMLSAAFLDLQRRTRTLDPVAGAATQVVTVVDPGEPAQIGCVAVTQRFFDVLGVRPALGRGFTQAHYDAALAHRASANPDGPRPTPPVIILSDGLWRRRLSSDPDIVGTQIRVAGGERVDIVGVMGPELEALGAAMPGQCWFPEVPDPAVGAWRPFIVIGRLAEGRSIREANAELAVIGVNLDGSRLPREPQTLQALGLLDDIVGRVRTQLIFLFGAVVCVLLVTCANVVNLFLAHAAGRRDELATRVALGASGVRLLRQSLTESLLIALAGGACGFLLAVWAVPVLVSMAPPNIPRLRQIAVDWSTFGFTLLVSGAVGICCALLASRPTRQVPRTVFGPVQAATTPRTTRLRHGVTVCEIALALMLAVAATLMVRTLRALNAIDLGFDPTAVVSADLNSIDNEMRAAQDFQTTIVERVKALPGVRAAGIGLGPLQGDMFIGGLAIPGDPRNFGSVRVDAVSPGYFEALGARLLAGRFFEPHDAVRDGPAVILVNQSAARMFWKGSDPIGKTVVISKSQRPQVIGMIADVRGSSLEEEPGPAIYQLSNQTRNFFAGSMLIRVDGEPQALVPGIRAVIRSMSREQPFRGVSPLQERIDSAMAPRLFVLRLIGLFSVLGLILAVVGVYAVLAEFVNQRVPEIGVRMAFGATASDVLALILGQGSKLVAIGIALGLAGAVLLRGVMSTMVWGVHTFDPLAYLTACLLLLAATVAACAVPARRASRLDPAVALRSE
ncbi:MAG TPA: ABC transporter permease [Vicinamibacterales bacterium]|nr:ABC transporter permease [Vicinamibacterales bacterium]